MLSTFFTLILLELFSFRIIPGPHSLGIAICGARRFYSLEHSLEMFTPYSNVKEVDSNNPRNPNCIWTAIRVDSKYTATDHDQT